MKFIRYIVFSLLLIAGCASEVSEKVGLAVDVRSLEFAASGGKKTIIITASEPLCLIPDGDWVTVTKGAKDKNHKTYVTVSVSANPLSQARSMKVSVVAGEETAYIDITQAAGYEIKVPAEDLAENLSGWLGMGWNLGNHFDAHNNGVSGETAWGNPKATQATFDKIRAAGFKTVRIPVTWLGQFGSFPGYKIQASWLDRVAEVVGYAENAGLNAIINMHHDGADGNYWLDIQGAAEDETVHQRILAQITAMWTQIAEKFKDKGHFLVFEAFNEIHDGGWGWGANRNDGGKQYACLNEWNQAFVDAVRATGGQNSSRILGIPAYCTNVDIAIGSFKMPEDSAEDRLMLSVHCYDPTEYTLTAKYSEWGHTADTAKKYPGDNEGSLRRVFEKISDNFISKGIPVYLGEFGCVNRASEQEQKFQQYYLKYYAKLSKLYGVPSILWDNGAAGAGNEKHAFVNHATGEYCSDEAKAAVRALITSYNSSESLDDIYDSAP